jgi:hypothetical protein
MTTTSNDDKSARLAALKAKMQADAKKSFDGKKDSQDFWQVQNGESKVRLLQHPNDASPIFTHFNHALEINGKWFIEDCPGCIGLLCPCCELGVERKEYSVSNVFVIAPQAGAIQWWKYGGQVLSRIVEAAENGLDAFDPIAGATLLVTKPRYENSRFLAPSALGTEEQIAAVLARTKPLRTMLNLKSYAELQTKYHQMGGKQ